MKNQFKILLIFISILTIGCSKEEERIEPQIECIPEEVNIPDSIHLTFEPTNVIYTWKNYLLEYTSDDSNNIKFSKDLGKTWTTWENPYGHIARVHIFSEGTIMFCTTTRVFTTKDFITVEESKVLDIDGTPFIPNAVHFFTITQQDNKNIIIDGTEIEAWGDYMITQAQGASSYVPRFWYTTDYGKTVKASIKGGGVRHFHHVEYNDFTNKFIITTGDSHNENKVIESSYSPSTDEWIHREMLSGNAYKFGASYFDENYTYFITDYTNDTPMRGILRCDSDSLGDASAYEYVYKSNNEVYPLINLYEDSNGNKMLTADEQAKNTFYYARGDFDFQTVTHDYPNSIGRMTPVNNNGDMYGTLFTNNYSRFSTVRQPTVNLTQAFRNAGITDFNKEQCDTN